MSITDEDTLVTRTRKVMSAVESLKLVIVGDGAVGKSALLITHTTNSFPSEYVPTVFDNYSVNKCIDGKVYSMGLWDTAGQEDYDRLRPLSYPDTDIFLVCFDINNKDSFENIRDKWMPEITHYCPDTPRILVGCKRDLRTASRAESQVSVVEAKKLASELKLQHYVETSSLEFVGLDTLFDMAVKLAVAGKQNNKSKKKSIFNIKRRKTANGPMEVVVPPVMPPTGFAPEVEIETCTKGDQWLALLKDDSCADTILILSTGQEILAHKAMLASSSTNFRKAFGLETKKVKYRKQTTPSSNLPGIKKVELGEDCQMTRVYLADSVEAEVLENALEFLYAGVLVFEQAPDGELLDGLREFSDLFSLPYLKQICDNIENDEEELNPSIGTYVCDQMGQQIKDLFLNKQTCADVKFVFPEQEVFAHKCLLSSRNKIMSVMFDGRFQEGNKQDITTIDMRKDRDVDVDTFLTMLEYVYTGHTPLDEGVDPVSLLILSDRYNVTRLINLIELFITKVVDKKCFKNIEKADIDVIGLLNVSRMYNAEQLTKWCLHFISSNYIAFAPRPEWNQLSSEDMQHIEEHRWPPVDYLNEVREYEALVAEAKEAKEAKASASGAGCVVM